MFDAYLYTPTTMTGWEVYAPDWGHICDLWQDRYYAKVDDYFLNYVKVYDSGWDTIMVLFIRQPEDKGTTATRLRMHSCSNIVKRQWLQAMYNPTRVICKRRLLKDFHALV